MVCFCRFYPANSDFEEPAFGHVPPSNAPAPPSDLLSLPVNDPTPSLLDQFVPLVALFHVC